MPRVLAFRLILTCDGFSLPKDERGSGSWEVWSDALEPFGPATHVDSERSVAKRSRGSRHVFRFDAADVRGRIAYVGRNPPRAGLQPQRWSFAGRVDDRAVRA